MNPEIGLLIDDAHGRVGIVCWDVLILLLARLSVGHWIINIFHSVFLLFRRIELVFERGHVGLSKVSLRLVLVLSVSGTAGTLLVGRVVAIKLQGLAVQFCTLLFHCVKGVH